MTKNRSIGGKTLTVRMCVCVCVCVGWFRRRAASNIMCMMCGAIDCQSQLLLLLLFINLRSRMNLLNKHPHALCCILFVILQCTWRWRTPWQYHLITHPPRSLARQCHECIHTTWTTHIWRMEMFS